MIQGQATRFARPILRAFLCALPLSLLGMVLLDFGVRGGEFVLIVMPGVTGAVLAARYYAVDAMLCTLVASGLSALAAVRLFFGPVAVNYLAFLLLDMFTAAVIGIFAGIALRPMRRRWFGP